MSSYNYNQAKLLTILSSQYLIEDIHETDKNVSLRNNDNLTDFISCGANGYILIPFSVAHSSNFPETERNYGLLNMENASPQDNTVKVYEECLDKMAIFAHLILNKDEYAKIWIGLPQIDKDVADSYSNAASYHEQSILVMHHAATIAKYLVKAYYSFSNIWSNVQGFYYNQEHIYNENFNFNNTETIREYNLMNIVSNFVHGTVPHQLNCDSEIIDINSTDIQIEKDMIWIPYVPAYAPVEPDNLDGSLLIHKTYDNIGKIIGNTNVFNCAFIQANLIGLFKDDKIVYNKTYPENYRYPLTQERIVSGKTNISTIYDSIKSNKLLFPDKNPVVASPSSNCVIGCEYELNATKECTTSLPENKALYYVQNKTLYRPYLKYNSFVGNKPVALYWEASTTSAFNNMIQWITEVYSNTAYNPKKYSLNSSCDNILDSFGSSMLYYAVNSLSNSLNNYLTTTVTISLNSCYKEMIHKDIASAIVEAYKADNPEKFWIKSITYIPANTYPSNQITFSISRISGSGPNHISIFNNSINAILNSLNITSSLDDFEIVHRIYMWLIANVSLTDEGEDDYIEYYNTAYGAINPSYRIATDTGMAAAFAVLCKSAGVHCILTNGYVLKYECTWNYVYLSESNKWWFIDVCEGKHSGYKYKYFLRETPASYSPSFDLPNIETGINTYIKYGDVDDDGYITTDDANITLQKAINPSYYLDTKALIAADVTATGTITTDDSDAITAKYIQNTPLPVENYIHNNWI